MIPEKLYREIFSVLPILTVDIVIRSEAGQVSLVRRKNEPIKGH